MKIRFFIAIALLTTMFFFGCDLGIANDPAAKAALSASTGDTATQTADTEIPVEFSDGAEIPVEFSEGAEIPVEFSDGSEIPVEFTDGTEIPVEFTGGYEIPVEFVE